MKRSRLNPSMSLAARPWLPTAIVAALVLALVVGCEVDPDDDFGTGPVPGQPGDDGEGPDDGDTPTPLGCGGHCDCAPNQYCSATGTCQPVLVQGNNYCCSRLDSCPTGEVCHVEGTAGEESVCP